MRRLRFIGLSWIPFAAPICLALFMGAAPFSCTPLSEDWGLNAIDVMETPPDPPMACDIGDAPADRTAKSRASCTYGQGSRASETLGIPTDYSDQIPIRHVIIVMKENRSYDHLYGALHNQGQKDSEAIPKDFFNPDPLGKPIAPFHASTTCIPFDPAHQYASVIDTLDGGSMKGFVRNAAKSSTSRFEGQTTNGEYAMSGYDSSDLPFYYWLANTYAVADRHFAPVASGTASNRAFFVFGNTAGVVDTGVLPIDPSIPSIFKTLMTSGHTWAAYTDGEPFSGVFGWKNSFPGVHSMQELYDALDNGTLPNVAFVDGIENIDDDHPYADLQVGEEFVRRIYQHAVKSPQWSRLAIIYTYDEAGSFADHVPPPDGCQAKPSLSPFVARGPRVPLVAISRWAKPHYVSHVVRDHTSVLRFIETLFDLPALTARDANSDAMMDLFDFSCSQPATPPQEAPKSGTGGCDNAPTP